MIARTGVVSLGIFLMAVAEGAILNLTGLGVWWVGVLLIVDSFLDGRARLFLWQGGGAVAVVGYWTGLASIATKDVGQLVVALLSVSVAGLVLLRSKRVKPRTGDPLRVWGADVEPVGQPAGPTVAPPARILAAMTRYLERARAERSAEAGELISLLDNYRSRHGTDTVDTSRLPADLRAAVTDLAQRMHAVGQRQPVDAPGHANVVVAVRYADLLVDSVLRGRAR